MKGGGKIGGTIGERKPQVTVSRETIGGPGGNRTPNQTVMSAAAVTKLVGMRRFLCGLYAWRSGLVRAIYWVPN